MSQVPSATASSTDFETIFRAALESYKQQTKKDIASHPIAIQLRSCDSPSAVLAQLRVQNQALDQSKGVDQQLTTWLDPTVNALYAFSATLRNGAGLAFPPSNAIFAAIGVLFQAVKDARASQSALVDLFGRIESFFKRLEAFIKVPPTVAMTRVTVKIMVEVLSILGIMTKEIGHRRKKKYLEELVGRKDVEDAFQRLDKLTQEVARMAAAEALKITHRIDDKVGGADEKDVDHKVGSVTRGVKENRVAVQQAVTQVGDPNRNELRNNLRQWIAPPDPSVNFNAASDAQHGGTAAWCTEGNTLVVWKTSGSLLWIHGKLGSGKSILSSVIVRDIKSMSNAGSAFLAYFYFDYKDTAKHDSRALLSSLLVQLSDQSDIFCDALDSLYDAHQRGSVQPTTESLTKCLKDMITITGQVPIYLLIDALDECPNDSGIPSSRGKVLQLVKELAELHQPNLRLCLTSCLEFDIRITLEPLATQRISLDDECGQKQDINDYVTFVVHSDRKMKRWRDSDKNAVIENLIEKGDGTFQWVVCQLEVLRHCFPTNLRRILEGLPKSLDETYKRITKEIDNANREHVYRLLQCLTVARRPLRVEELAEVLAFDLSTGEIPTMIAVLSACSSLVSVVIDNGSQVVQLSHFSVKEFLMSDRLASCIEEVSRFHIAIEPSHMILAQACLGVLIRLDDRSSTDSAEKLPLLQYAVDYWDVHALVGNVELQIKEAMDDFFDANLSRFLAWVRIRRIENLFDNVPGSDDRTFVLSSAIPLYFAAWNGFRGLVERLIVKRPRYLKRCGGTLLHASVLRGHIEIAQLLFAHGVDINSRPAGDWTPLHTASKEGNVEVWRWLLNRGADINSRTRNGRTPLHFAVSNGHLEISRILLTRNAEVNTQDDEGSTPLHHVTHTELGQLLLDHGANVHVRDNKGHTPLHLAATNGHHGVSRTLLKHNAEVNVQDDERSTPLHHAARHLTEHIDVVQLLLVHNAEVNVRDNKGRTPLHLASNRGHLEVTRILLERNAEVNAKDDEGSTPLHYTTFGWMRNAQVVRLLLDHNAIADVRDNDGLTPLHLAASSVTLARIHAEISVRYDGGFTPVLNTLKRINARIVQILLDYNVDADVRDNKGRTPLHFAAANGHVEVAQILLERKVDVNVRNDDGFTPLLIASRNSNAHIVRSLLDHNADANVRDNKGQTPLHLAATNGHLEVAQILLERNVEVDAHDDEGSTPLQRAILGGRWGTSPEVVQLLLDHNADVHVRIEGYTVLHLAVINGHLDVSRMLLEYNAEVNAQDDEGSTPLHHATQRGTSPEIVRLLLVHNTDVKARDNKGRTSLHLAVTTDRLEVAQILLDCNAEVNAQDNEGSTPLHNATREEIASREVIRLLLGHNADVNVRGDKGQTPLHLAVDHSHLKVVQILLKCNADVNARDDEGLAPLHLATRIWVSIKAVQLLLHHNADADVRNDKGQTPLHSAASNVNLEVARILLKWNADVNARDDEGLSPLHHVTRCFCICSASGDTDVVRLLLDHNADVDVRDNKGQTPLHLAATNGHLEVAQILLERNAMVNAQDDEGSTPLHRVTRSLWATMKHYPDVVRLLLDHNADADVRDNKGRTPLRLAATNGHLEVAQILLERNAEVNAQDGEGLAPLHHVSLCWREHTDVVRLLLDHNADADVRDNKGRTPLHFAVSRGYLEAARTLLERDAKVNTRDDEGSTPLHHATRSEFGSVEIVQLLLDHGVDVQTRNICGETASDVVWRQDVLRLLSQYAAAERTNKTKYSIYI